ncbi:hypothetical protein AB0M29_13675 [Streptomyces sp. NPDC051976]|uniref:hypothetical protein n=1 Tax=Streptomyces sp. NPDC051976 TaxID=3154947 RepID=UPI003420D7F1
MPSTATPAPTASDPKPTDLAPMAAADDSGLTTAQRQALDDAKQQAAKSGTPVVVDALTTETSTTTANPDGALTQDSSLLPTRVRHGSGWVPVDATLVRNDDGTYRPAAASGALKLSGGGASAPLASLGTGDQQLSFGWPTDLPTPVASGASLTYPDVLTGVDLKVTATTLGGFSEVLIVKSPSAAADPALRTLTLALHSTGVTVKDDSQDNLTAVGPGGGVVFSAPRPIMWDSAHAPNAPASVKAPADRSASAEVRAAAADPVTPDAGPPPGAHVADVQTKVTKDALTLSPDQSMLTASNTVYPLYIDPTWNPHPESGTRQHWNEVQAACPTTTSNYDSTAYGDPGVGNNTYTGCVGVERSYFQLSVPSTIWGTHIVSAAINVMETYAAQCDTTSTINMYLTSAINSKFSWNNKPAAGSKIDSRSFAPACTSYVSSGYSATSTVARAAAGHWSSLAYVLINANESNGYHFKRFAANPSMSITYNHVPSPPTGLAVKLNATSYGCGANTPYPILGKTIATTPPTLTSVTKDGDSDEIQASYTYWSTNNPTHTVVRSKDVGSGTAAPAVIPASFISGLPDGEVVSWQVTASDGKDTSATAGVCHFTVDQRAPDEPIVTTQDNRYPDLDNGGGPGVEAGTPGTFHATHPLAPVAAWPTKYVFGLDAEPPTTNPPAAQVVPATNSQASFTVTPVAPGRHTLWVYAVDAAGNDSIAHPYHFTAVGHVGKTYSSLSAAFNNIAVTKDTAQSVGNVDGTGHSFSLQDLQAAGWQPGQKVTIDGASFVLPNFGAGSADNVLAANQTITMNNERGNAIVFLATSTYGGSASDHQAEDHSSPYVPDDTPVSGTNCTLDDSTYKNCSEASGTVTYADGTTNPRSYYLPVPDWSVGPSSVSVLTLPHANGPTGQLTSAHKIYAIAVPIKAGVPISSVTLPDLSDTAQAHIPALHIFGMAVRNTTSGPNGSSWTGSWSSPTDTPYQFAGRSFGNQTVRTTVTPSIGGDSVRIRLSNSQGRVPLAIDSATLANQGSAWGTAAGTPVRMTFNGGATSVTVPIGGEVYSDPLPFPVTAGKGIVASYHLVNAVDYLVMHTNGSAALTYFSALGSGDHTMDTANSAFSGTGTAFIYGAAVLAAVDVTGSSPRPTVAVLGDGLYNVSGSTVPPAAPRVSDNLASAFQSNDQGVSPAGVIAAGIPNNFLTQDKGPGGLAALTRLDRDVFSAPGISTVVIYEGGDDILTGANDAVVTDGYQVLRDQLQAWGIRAVFLTLTPCGGHPLCTAGVEDNRLTVNQWITSLQATLPPGCTYIDINGSVAIDDPNSQTDPPLQDLSAGSAPLDFDTGDHVNLTTDGYAAVSQTLTTDLSQVTPQPQ